MNAKGRPIELNGKTYNMVYTSAAMLEVYDKYGDVSGMADKLDDNQKEAARIVPWLVSLLCNQGIMLDMSGMAKVGSAGESAISIFRS